MRTPHEWLRLSERFRACLPNNAQESYIFAGLATRPQWDPLVSLPRPGSAWPCCRCPDWTARKPVWNASVKSTGCERLWLKSAFVASLWTCLSRHFRRVWRVTDAEQLLYQSFASNAAFVSSSTDVQSARRRPVARVDVALFSLARVYVSGRLYLAPVSKFVAAVWLAIICMKLRGN